MQSAPFGNRVRDYLRVVGYSQQDLARALALHPVVLSRKLRGTANAYLTQQEIKRIITLLAEWRALSRQQEVLSLLELAHLTSGSLSEEEWNTPPLSELDRDASPVPSRDSTPPPSSVPPSPAAWPSPMTRLIGRQWEMQRLTQLLSRDQVRLLTLVGPGGSGWCARCRPGPRPSAPDAGAEVCTRDVLAAHPDPFLAGPTAAAGAR